MSTPIQFLLSLRQCRRRWSWIVWDDVYGFDYSCIKDIALREPLVDCVELKAVVSQPCAIRHIDIRTVKKEDLTFRVPFELKATRNDCKCLTAYTLYLSRPFKRGHATREGRMSQAGEVWGWSGLDVHAFLGWFDISFSCCHKPINFSTGPQAKVSYRSIPPLFLSLQILIRCSTRIGNRPYSTPMIHWQYPQVLISSASRLAVADESV